MSSPQGSPAAPAFKNLVDAFASWQEGEGLSPREALALEYVNPRPRPIPVPRAYDFIRSCPSVDVSEIDDDHKDCISCTNRFRALGAEEAENDACIAKRLACGHLMCNGCLFEWLCPFDITNNNTCPHCRAVCFPKFEPGNTAEGIQARIDLVDWTNEQSQRPSPPFEQEMLDFLRVALVIRREEAMEELEVDRAKVESLLQSKFDSGEGDWTVVLAYRLEMLQFEVRVSTIGAIQAQIWVYKQLQKYRNQLQEMTDALEVIQVGLQEIRNELEIVMEEHRAVPEPEAGGIRAEGFVSEECGELEDGESIETVGDWIRARTDNN